MKRRRRSQDFLVRMCVYCVKCTKFGKLFLRKVIKTVATRCLDFSSKRPKMRLAAGLCPDPLGELKRSPRPPSRKSGPTSKGRGREGRGGILPDQSKYGCYGPEGNAESPSDPWVRGNAQSLLKASDLFS